jgi:hypothetical protein
LLVHAAEGAALKNITLALPEGSSDHGTPGLLCTPTKWTDLAWFYLFNYVAHAATVIIRPGERSFDFAVTVMGSLLFPGMGLYRGIEAILSGASLCGSNNDLRKASRSGALCMLVRSREWRPVDNEKIDNAVVRRQLHDDADTSHRGTISDQGDMHLITYEPPWILSKFGCPIYVHRQIIHGTYSLPAGYRFAIVPSETQFTELHNATTKIEVAATYNVVKALVALAQTGYASVTLYRSRGDQIDQFGFAAFGLTVAPYAVMSMVNLVGNLCRPDYASLYMVESSIMDEARKRGGVFNGIVARVEEEQSRHVCSCKFADGEDVEDLTFVHDHSQKIEARFNTTAPPNYLSSKEKETPSLSSSVDEHTIVMQELPEKMDYTVTGKDSLLLVPSCNPPKLAAATSDTSIDDPIASRYRIDGVKLRKYHPFNKVRRWKVHFELHTTLQHAFHYRALKYILSLIVSLTPVLINGVLSQFRPGSIPDSESNTWKVYTIQWMILGAVTGLFLVLDHEAKDAIEMKQRWLGPRPRILLYMTSASPAIGGFIVVGQMVVRYGMCTWVGS